MLHVEASLFGSSFLASVVNLACPEPNCRQVRLARPPLQQQNVPTSCQSITLSLLHRQHQHQHQRQRQRLCIFVLK